MAGAFFIGSNTTATTIRLRCQRFDTVVGLCCAPEPHFTQIRLNVFAISFYTGI
jgi:hypothetical protein